MARSGMLCALVLTLCAAGAAATARLPLSAIKSNVKTVGSAQQWQAPWFCHELDCPKYSVQKTYKNDTIELRSYEGSVWASTNVSGVGYDEAVRTGFLRLFKYISGANLGEHKIDMTAPVKVRAVPGAGPFCESHFIVSFMVPFELQNAPPQPSAKNVYIESLPAASFYVVAFGGWTSETKLIEHVTGLLQDLDQMSVPYNGEYFYSAGYDAPFRLLNRHNEVWVESKP